MFRSLKDSEGLKLFITVARNTGDIEIEFVTTDGRQLQRNFNAYTQEYNELREAFADVLDATVNRT